MSKPMWTPGPYSRAVAMVYKNDTYGYNLFRAHVSGVAPLPERIATARLFEHANELVDALRALAAVAPDSPECAVALALIDRLEAPL